MTTPMPFAPVAKPPRAALALALAIVKNKPAGTPVKDYILDLRTSIRESENPKPILTNFFFDSVEHWQRAYIKAEGEQIKLHNTIFELKQQNEALVAKLNAATPPPKRKAFSAVENEPENNRKRPKTRNLRTQSQRDISSDIASQDQDVNREQETEQGVSFLRHIFALQRTLQAKRRKTKALAVDAVIACKEAEQGLLTAIRAEATPPAPPKPFRASKSKSKGPDFLAVVNAVDLTFKLVHEALHKVPQEADDGQSQSKIVYYLVCLFESTMTGLTQNCTAVSKEKIAGNGATGTTRAKPRQKMKAGGSTSAKQNTAQVLVDLLCKMALSLDMSRVCDQQVMEGYLHTILDRLGKMLALFTFNDIQLPTHLSPDMRPPEGLTAMREEDMSRQIAQLEAEKLISFLNRVLKNETLFPPAGPASGGQLPFNLKVQEAMKKTLLQAVFGKEDPLFQGGLERPETPPPADCWAPPNRQMDFAEWFAGELWRLIGWEILDPTRSSRP